MSCQFQARKKADYDGARKAKASEKEKNTNGQDNKEKEATIEKGNEARANRADDIIPEHCHVTERNAMCEGIVNENIGIQEGERCEAENEGKEKDHLARKANEKVANKEALAIDIESKDKKEVNKEDNGKMCGSRKTEEYVIQTKENINASMGKYEEDEKPEDANDYVDSDEDDFCQVILEIPNAEQAGFREILEKVTEE